MSNASLAPQYWRIETLRGEAVKGIEGKGLRFTPGATTVVGCPPPLGDLEGTLLSVLGAARTWAIHGQVLELFEASGASIATLEAVYLR